MDDDITLTQQDLIKVFHVRRGTIYLWVKNNPDFPKPFKIGRRLLWRRSDIEAYIESQKRDV